MIGKRKIRIALIACLMLSLYFGNSALAVCIPFDVHTSLEPIQIKSGESGIQPYGTYLAEGTCTVTEIGTGMVRISAETSCYRVSDVVTADVYLESKEGGSWWTLTYKQGTGYNTNYVCTSKDYAVARGQYYRVEGSHTAQKGSAIETAVSLSGNMYID